MQIFLHAIFGNFLCLFSTSVWFASIMTKFFEIFDGIQHSLTSRASFHPKDLSLPSAFNSKFKACILSIDSCYKDYVYCINKMLSLFYKQKYLKFRWNLAIFIICN